MLAEHSSSAPSYRTPVVSVSVDNFIYIHHLSLGLDVYSEIWFDLNSAIPATFVSAAWIPITPASKLCDFDEFLLLNIRFLLLTALANASLEQRFPKEVVEAACPGTAGMDCHSHEDMC